MARLQRKNEVIEATGKAQGQWYFVWRQLRQDRAALVGAGVLILIILLTVFAPIVSVNDPLAQSGDPADYLSKPSIAHPFGTDALRRDVLARVLHGGRTTLQAGILSTLGAAIVGLSLGLLAGFNGGRVDDVISRIIDVLLTLPGILLAIVIIAILGPGLQNAMIAVATTMVPTFARLVRSVTLAERNKEYVWAARALGSKSYHIIRKHIVPNVIAPVIVIGTLNTATAIQVAAGLSFLGLGAQPPSPEWGAMLSNGRNYIRSGDWWMTVYPGIAIFVTVLSINLLGDGLRDALDPRLRGES